MIVAGIGEGGIAHPDPDQLVLFDHRKVTDIRRRGNARLIGNARARPFAVEFHAVVTAADDFAVDVARS